MGHAIPRDFFDYSAEQNPHGFGVMSARDGVRHFFGKKARKRARRYSADLSAAGVTHGVHWRWATHGSIGLHNVHPFTTPDGRAHIMHNGVIHATAKHATAEKSDTALFVAMLTDTPEESPGQESQFWGNVQEAIGTGSRMLVLHGATFYILNESAGVWIDGVWYSNTYSLPLGAAYGDDDGDDSAAVLTTGDGWSAAQDRAYWDTMLRETVGDPARYDVNTGRWRTGSERKRPDDGRTSAFRDWLNKLQPYAPAPRQTAAPSEEYIELFRETYGRDPDARELLELAGDELLARAADGDTMQ